MKYTPITGTLGYILSLDRSKILMVNRSARPHDNQYGKYNGLGGKLQRDEDVVTCMQREILEESGLVVTDMHLRGTINWTNFGPKGEDWLVFIFLIVGYSGEPFAGNEEGDLEWVPLDNMSSVPMWDGDRHFLPLVFDDDARMFHGYMPYDREKPVGWTFKRI